MQTDDLQIASGFRRPIVPKQPRRLAPTSLSLQAYAMNSSTAPSDMNEFADLYHPAVRAFIGSMVRDSAAHHELTQKFFVDVVMQGQLLRHVDRASAAFRDDLKHAVRNFLSDERRRHQRKKRRTAMPGIQDSRVLEWDGVIQLSSPAQDSAFLRGWAQGIVQTALRQVSESFRQKGKQQHFRLFVGRFLAPADAMPSWRALGEPFAVDERTARSRAETAARHVRIAIRQLVAAEGGSSETVDDAMRELIAQF
jgi:DNA-directed RNA polymerase specialized sigma24 family protein